MDREGDADDGRDRANPLARAFAAMVVALRWPIVLAWIAAAVAATVALPALGQSGTAPIDDLVPGDAAAIGAQQRSAELFRAPLTSDTAIVQRDPRGLSRELQQRHLVGARAVARGGGKALPDLKGAVPVVNLPVRGLPARERETTAITYLFFAPDAGVQDREEVAGAYAERFLQGPGAPPARVTGAAPARLAQFDAIEDALPIIEIASVLLIGAVLLIAFRSVGAPLVTLLSAAVAFLVAIRVLAWCGERADVSIPREVEPVVVVLLLGLVTDYCVFFLSSLREQLRRGEAKVPAARAAVADTVPLVFTAGLIVAAGTAALLAGRLDFFRAFGPGLALTALIAVAVSLTLVPALVAIGGRRLFGKGLTEEARNDRAGRRRRRRTDGDGPRARLERTDAVRATRRLARTEPTPFWRLFVARIMAARPVALITVLVCTAGLAAVASGVGKTELGLTFIRALPGDDPVRRAADDAARGFAPGILSPTEIVVERPGGDPAALVRLEELLERQPGVAAVLGPREQPRQAVEAFVLDDLSAARYGVVLDVDPLGAPAIDRLRVLRERLPALLSEAGLDRAAAVAVGGETALADETVASVLDDLKRIGAAVLIVNFVLLALFMRALGAPLYLLAASVLGFAASLGLTTLLFQDALGQAELTYYVPFAAAVLLVALGSDYNIFIAGRIWRESRHRPLRDALAVATPAAAKAIRVAGLILAASFALLAVVPLRSFREFAFLMCAGVLIDSFIVRSLLIPGLVSVVGERSWWPGRRRAARAPVSARTRPATRR